MVLADTYSSRAIRDHVGRRGIRAVIPVPADRRGHRSKEWRGIAPCYEKTATIHLAGLHIAGISL